MTEATSGNSGQTERDTFGVKGENSGILKQYFIYTKSEAEIHSRPLLIGSPYIGLKEFGSDDKDKFFGRQRWINNLWSHIQKKNVLLLMGASGSGKSSLVRAGLIPRLKDEWGTSQLINLTFVPDKDPFLSLFVCIAHTYGQEKAGTAFNSEADTLIQVVSELKKDSQCLIFIDQFEELFTISQKAKCDKFIDSLVQLIEVQDNSIKIVLTMRADFSDKISPYPGLVNIFNSYSRMALS